MLCTYMYRYIPTVHVHVIPGRVLHELDCTTRPSSSITSRHNQTDPTYRLQVPRYLTYLPTGLRTKPTYLVLCLGGSTYNLEADPRIPRAWWADGVELVMVVPCRSVGGERWEVRERENERAAGFRLVGGKVGRELMKDCLTSGLVCLLVVIL